MLSDEWLPRYRLLENFTAKWNGNGNGNAHGNGNAYDRGDYNSSFALRAVELKIPPHLNQLPRPLTSPTYIIFVFSVMFIHELQQLDLYLSLIQERLLVLDDLDSYRFLVRVVVRLHDLEIDK